MSGAGMEIERRWLMAGWPAECGAPAAGPRAPVLLGEIEKAQGYLATAPVVRIRSEHTVCAAAEPDAAPTPAAPGKWEYILCVKGKGTLARQEIETPLTAETFEKLREFIGVPLITKRVRLYRLADGRTLECSLVDEGQDTAFYYAEVEFDSIEDAAAFVPPAWLGEEKTEDPSFSMKNYWEKKTAHHRSCPLPPDP